MGIELISTVFWTIVVLSVLVFFHELGHHLAAKMSGIRVERFSIGFPPRAFGFQWGETDYCISWVPLGGYCKMAGMVDESLDTKNIKGEPWEFLSKSIPVRMWVLFAGPLANFIVAIALFAGVAFFSSAPVLDGNGQPVPDPSAVVGQYQADGPADRAGITTGDRILSIDGIAVSTWQDMTGLIQSRALETVAVEYQRGEEIFSTEVTFDKGPISNEQGAREVGKIGILQARLEKSYGFFGSINYGVKQTYVLTSMIVSTIKQLVMGEQGLNSFGGPIMIGQITEQSRQAGPSTFAFFIAFLSLNLGFMNLLPLPVLDGGHLVILSAEGISRRQLPIKAKLLIQQIGMALLLLLIIVIFYNDIIRVTS